jgi:hypothetical protein
MQINLYDTIIKLWILLKDQNTNATNGTYKMNDTTELLVFLLFIQKIPGSNINQETGYLDWSVL